MRRSRRSSRWGDDGGAASILVAALIASLLAIAVAGIWLGAVVVARHRAQAAADLAALSAAGRLPAGPAQACQQAQAVAARMGGAMRVCRIEGLDVVVAVGIRVGGRTDREATAVARAGPPSG